MSVGLHYLYHISIVLRLVSKILGSQLNIDMFTWAYPFLYQTVKCMRPPGARIQGRHLLDDVLDKRQRWSVSDLILMARWIFAVWGPKAGVIRKLLRTLPCNVIVPAGSSWAWFCHLLFFYQCSGIKGFWKIGSSLPQLGLNLHLLGLKQP